MKLSIATLSAAAMFVLAACSAPQPAAPDDASATETAPAAAAAPPQAATPASDTASPAASDAAPAAPADAQDESMPNAGVQAGWYTAGTFRACGSAAALKIDKPDDIDRQIREGGMSAADPVYVRVEGMPMSGDTYMLTRVVQVGSKTPVRDCPMTGTTTQVGG